MSANKFTTSTSTSSTGASGAGNSGAGTASEVKAVTSLLDVTPAEALSELSAFMVEEGLPSYRARQVLRHLWIKPAASFNEMSDLPRARRAVLAAPARNRCPPAVIGRNSEVPLPVGGWSGDRGGGDT